MNSMSYTVGKYIFMSLKNPTCVSGRLFQVRIYSRYLKSYPAWKVTSDGCRTKIHRGPKNHMIKSSKTVKTSVA
jgi:hypothetical protein